MAEEGMCRTMPLYLATVDADAGYAGTRRMDEVLVASLRGVRWVATDNGGQR